jgi:predicted amidophosphoribosyltransferase
MGNIIIVDDIFTTGSTLNACAKVLRLNGANFILGVTFAVGE